MTTKSPTFNPTVKSVVTAIRQAKTDGTVRAAMRHIVPTDPASDFRSAQALYPFLSESGDGSYFKSELAVATALYLWATTSSPSYRSTSLTLGGAAGDAADDAAPKRRKTFAHSMRELAIGRNGVEAGRMTRLSPGVVRRVAAAMASKSLTELVPRLRSLCEAAEREGVAIDYAQLAADLFWAIKDGGKTLDTTALARWNKNFWAMSSEGRKTSTVS
jgi:hypothetical protein